MVPWACIECSCVLFSPVVTCDSVRNSTVGSIITGNGKETVTPYLTFAYTLHKDRKVKAFIICAQTDTVFKSRCFITNYFLIARVFYSAGAITQFSVSIQVGIFYVARTKFEVTGLQEVLIYSVRVFQFVHFFSTRSSCCYFFSVQSPYSNQFAVIVIYEIIFLIQTFCSVAPYFAIFLAYIIIAD